MLCVCDSAWTWTHCFLLCSLNTQVWSMFMQRNTKNGRNHKETMRKSILEECFFYTQKKQKTLAPHFNETYLSDNVFHMQRWPDIKNQTSRSVCLMPNSIYGFHFRGCYIFPAFDTILMAFERCWMSSEPPGAAVMQVTNAPHGSLY